MLTSRLFQALGSVLILITVLQKKRDREGERERERRETEMYAHVKKGKLLKL